MPMIKALAQVGILYTDSQKSELERRLVEVVSPVVLRW